jgi:DNA-binding response OmpR family regulator
MERILIAEDDRTVQKALLRLFEHDGFSVEVAGDGKSAIEAFHAAIPAAVVLDLGLPIISGQEVCREIRRESLAVPIIILSALSDVRYKILLLEMGADSYVTKPFSPRELLARVRALIRNAMELKHHAGTTFDGVCVDFENMKASLDGHPVELTPLEFKMLRFFLQNGDRVVSRDELLKEAFGYDHDPPLPHNVDVHIYRLRHKLEREPANPAHFRTIKGQGYKFVR